jgi:alkylation response protein AidB-like acyl-CoA dehydrogenase
MDAGRFQGHRTPVSDRYLLDGRKSFVLDGMIADLILVAACPMTGHAIRGRRRSAGPVSQAMQTST